MTDRLSARDLRRAIAELPDGNSHGERPAGNEIYLPPAHYRALDPEAAVVTGMRGAGKTFWWSAIQEGPVRRLIAKRNPRWLLGEDAEVRVGFGAAPEPDEYPGREVLAGLLAEQTEPRIVWKSVAAWQFASDDHPLRKCRDWPGRVRHVAAHLESVDRLLRDRDADFEGRNLYGILLFDALDRAADDWDTMARLIRGLLQVTLELRSYRRLRAKVFLRADQAEPSVVSDFPDAAKILAARSELRWPRREIYGLFWHCLSARLRGDSLDLPRNGDPTSRDTDEPGFRPISRRFIADEDAQCRKFHEITGPWMGTDPRRGFPYSWIPNHLGDAKQQVSPRPFLTALRRAAEDTDERYPTHSRALHYESIKRGVQEAFRVRVAELLKDYPWVDRFLRPLGGSAVPFQFSDITDCWRRDGVIDRLPADLAQDAVRLPPSRFEDGPEGIREDLEALGVFRPLLDGRVNLPDVYRVPYRIGRKGGIKPAR